MIEYLAWFFASLVVLYGTLNSNREAQISAASFFLVALGVFVGLGDMLGGYDRYIYAELFDRMADENHAGSSPWLTKAFAFYATEFGYGTLTAIISYITANRYIFIFIVTMIIYTLLLRSLKQYVENVPFAIVIFMGLWFFFTFTYLRQVIGCAVLWLSIKYIVDRDFKRFLLVVFIAFSFHNSCILFLPLYFVPIKKFPPKIVLYVMIGALAVGLSPIPQGLFSAYGEINEERIRGGMYEVDAGFRWAYLIEAIFFLFVILRNYERILEEKNQIIMLNLALVFCAVLLIFVRSENGGRLGWLFMIGVFCTLSNICVEEGKILPHGVLMIAVSFLLFFRILTAWGVQLYPYKTFLSDGYREGDIIRIKNEYDTRYDEDKFYRPVFWLFGE